MIVTIHQPEHLPWIGFCHKASLADVLVLLDVVQFRKNYFQNRNRILTANGPIWLTVPVKQVGHLERTIAQMEIDQAQHWAQKWWKSLSYSYARAPHFAEHASFFERIAGQEWRFIAELNEAIIRYLFEALDIRCQVIRASSLGADGSRSTLLAGICGSLGADVYLAGQHGRDYLDESLFTGAGIAVRHHAFTHPVYPQVHGATFVPNLSAVDLLFNCGPESGRIVRTGSPEPEPGPVA